jgi:hypothetical protein
VTISVESTPAGAGVYVGTETTPTCTAPCSFDAPRGGSAATVTLRLAGYADAKQTVELTGDQQVKLALEKKGAGKRKPAPTAKPVPTAKPDGTQPVGDNTLNPFK